MNDDLGSFFVFWKMELVKKLIPAFYSFKFKNLTIGKYCET